MDKLEVLKRVFGHESFREGQEQLVDELLGGHDVLGVMPTGAGKSVCYQLPALMLEGITLVISPLISLMKDQVMALKASGVAAAYINSSLTPGPAGRGHPARGGWGVPHHLRGPGAAGYAVLSGLCTEGAHPGCWPWTRRIACPSGDRTSVPATCASPILCAGCHGGRGGGFYRHRYPARAR